jgi:Tfp pilus assembly protein PilW
MTKIISIFLCLCIPMYVAASDGDPTPRRAMDSKDDALVKKELSKRWRSFGADDANTIVTREVNKGAGGTKGCNTTVGPAPSTNQPQGSARYGQRPQQSVTVVTGSVINVCGR